MPLEENFATSGALATRDFDWESARRAGLTPAERDALDDPAEAGAFGCAASSSAACSGGR
jgi:hypothetical protein